jgi:hypothetical protein
MQGLSRRVVNANPFQFCVARFGVVDRGGRVPLRGYSLGVNVQMYHSSCERPRPFNRMSDISTPT